MRGTMCGWDSEHMIATSSKMAASSVGGRSFRRTHLMATFFPLARCVPRHTVANEPDFSWTCQFMIEKQQQYQQEQRIEYKGGLSREISTITPKKILYLPGRSADILRGTFGLCILLERLGIHTSRRLFEQLTRSFHTWLWHP